MRHKDVSFLCFTGGKRLVSLACLLIGLSAGWCVPFGATPCAASPFRGMGPKQPPPPSPPESTDFHSAGMQAYNRQDYAEAEEMFRSGLGKAHLTGDKTSEALCYNGLGLVFAAMGQPEKALEAYKRAAPLWSALNNPVALAQNYNNQGLMQTYLGRYDLALDRFTQALAISEKQKDVSSTAVSLTNLGGTYFMLSQADNALNCFARALKLMEDMGFKPGVGSCLVYMGAAYSRLQRYAEAVKTCQRALPYLQDDSSLAELAYCQTLLGMTYVELEQYPQAAEALNRVIGLHARLGDTFQLIAALTSLSQVYLNQKQYEQALAACHRAEEIAAAPENRFFPMAFLVYRQIGEIQTRQRRYAEAAESYRRALDKAEISGNKQVIASCLESMGKAYMNLNAWDKAEAAYKRALKNYEAVSEQIVDPSRIGSFEEDNQGNLYARYARLLVQRKREREALLIAERGRGQGLARQAARSRAGLVGHLRPEEAQHLRAKTAALDAAGKAWRDSQQRNLPADADAQKALSRQIETARQQYQEAARQLTLYRDSLFARHPDFRRLEGANPLSSDELDALLRRHPDTLYLEWAVVDDETTLLFALSRQDGLKTFTLPVGKRALGNLVTDWRKALLTPENGEADRDSAQIQAQQAERVRAQALYAALFGPLEKAALKAFQSPRTHLTLVSDGPLLDLAFAALVDNKGRRLIERFPLSNAVSLGILTWPWKAEGVKGRRGEGEEQGTGKRTNHPFTLSPLHSFTLFCVADPTGAQGEVLRSPARGGFGRLLYARKEGEAVVTLFPGAKGLVGEKAREGAIKREMGRYALLHFATHGLFDAGNGLQSGLILAPEPVNSLEDGVLEAREIVGMRLSAQLATLSACQTARGQKSGGEGVLGLAWAFRAAGVPSIVASLWSVEDKATGQLMVAFYKALKAGKPKDEAMRLAMLTVKRERPEPFYWAAFQVIGDTEAIVVGAHPRAKRPPVYQQSRSAR